MNEEQITQDNIVYLINQSERTASIYSYEYDSINDEKIVKIPKSIHYKSTEYIITSILSNSFDSVETELIEFSPDSQIRTIEKNSFFNSAIESFTIPASLVNLEDGWMSGANDLKKVYVSPDNPRYKNYEDKFIIGKSTIDSENFDVLIFSFPENKKVTIPKFIKHIGPYAFTNNNELQSIEFESNSELQTIENSAFNSTQIECITIPHHLTKIGKYAFDACRSLRTVQIPEDSELQIIEKHAFSDTLIESFTVPHHLTKICEHAFSDCQYLKRIEIPEDSEINTIEKECFANTQIEEISIPASLVNLDEECFNATPKLVRVNVSPENPCYKVYEDKFIARKSSADSENFDFLFGCFTLDEKITIPNIIKEIGPYSFISCDNLKFVEIQENSNLQTIGKYAFYGLRIQKISIPHHTKTIDECAFAECSEFRSIEIPDNSELQTIGSNIFTQTKIESFYIPSKLIDLKDGWCCETSKLNRINISGDNSKYKVYEDKIVVGKSSIDSNVFDNLVFCLRNVEKVTIPSFVRKIESYAFQQSKVRAVDFEKNSQLQIIEEYAFAESSIEKFTVPLHLTKIYRSVFDSCSQLKLFDVSPNCELEKIDRDAFSSSGIKSLYLPPNIALLNFSDVSLLIVEFDENAKIFNFNQFSYSIDTYDGVIMAPKNIFEFFIIEDE